ncbi:transposase, partial [Paralimibaculum aggregatum]|uniref:transposase n=1 Tax=Paralimibaculum aggregatum TaxID=3036245 RepID=UPI002555E538
MESPAADIDLSALPPAYRAVFEAQKARIAELAEINKRLEHLVHELRHTVHGKRSEKLTEDERQLSFEDLEVAVAEVQEAADQAPATPGASRR